MTHNEHTEQSERAELVERLYAIADSLFALMGNSEVCGDDPETVRKVAALLAADKPAESGGEAATFEQAWAKYEAKGFRYGRDALEQVRFGWNIAHEYIKPQADKVGGEEDDAVAYLRAETTLPKYRGWAVCEDDDPNGFPVYRHPQPQHSALPDDVVKDAERYFPPEFEVWQGDEMCASASGPRDEALREAIRYAAQYEQDGPVRVFEVTRTFIDAAMLKEGKK